MQKSNKFEKVTKTFEINLSPDFTLIVKPALKHTMDVIIRRNSWDKSVLVAVIKKKTTRAMLRVIRADDMQRRIVDCINAHLVGMDEMAMEDVGGYWIVLNSAILGDLVDEMSEATV